MKHILFDTNIVLDVLLKRSPWSAEAKILWQANDEGRIVGYLTASSLSDIFYIARRLTDIEKAHRAIELCLQAFEICAVERKTAELALTLTGPDFEDNLQIACASLYHLEAIITRDKAGFKEAEMSVLTPTEAIKLMA